VPGSSPAVAGGPSLSSPLSASLPVDGVDDVDGVDGVDGVDSIASVTSRDSRAGSCAATLAPRWKVEWSGGRGACLGLAGRAAWGAWDACGPWGACGAWGGRIDTVGTVGTVGTSALRENRAVIRRNSSCRVMRQSPFQVDRVDRVDRTLRWHAGEASPAAACIPSSQ